MLLKEMEIRAIRGDVASLSVWRRIQLWRLGSGQCVSNQSQIRLQGEQDSILCPNQLRGIWRTIRKVSHVLSLSFYLFKTWVILQSEAWSQIFWVKLGIFIWAFTVETSGLLLCDKAGGMLTVSDWKKTNCCLCRPLKWMDVLDVLWPQNISKQAK